MEIARSLKLVPVFVIAACSACTDQDSPEPRDELSARDRAVRAIEKSLVSHGGLADIETARGITMRGSGTFDLSARFQGRSPDRPEPTPIEEQLSVDIEHGRLAFDIDWFNYVHSQQKLREIYDAQGRVLFADLRNNSTFWMPHPVVADQPQRYQRLIANLLLAEALQHPTMLEYLDPREIDGIPHDVIAFTTAEGGRLTLYLSSETWFLTGAETLIDMPLLGDTLVSWAWSEHRRIAGELTLPRRLVMRLGDRPLKEVELTYELGVTEAAFSLPPGLEADKPPEPEPFEPQQSAAAQPAAVVELAPGIYGLRNLRPGFHVIFAEFEDFVVAVDAPSGWYEMQYMPPMNWAGGDPSGALGRKFLDAIRTTIPDKPVRYLVLTHHHTDHIGGLRPFAAEGVTMLAGPATAAVARRAAKAPATLSGDTLGNEAELRIEVVEGQRVISDGQLEMRLIALPRDNPQAEDFLVVYFPRERIVYLTALIYPLPEPVFPLQESIPAMRWFVDWLDESGLPAERIYNIHGTGLVEPWQLDYTREL